jgi:hypothetical protein
MKTLFIIVILFTLTGRFAISQVPDSINCYIQLEDLWDLDLNKGTIKADFFLSIEFKDPLNTEMHLMNGTILKIDTLINNIEDGFLSLRFIAELRTNFEYRKFPLDNQKIEIEFEPYQYLEELVLISNPNQNIIVDTIHLNGWIVSGLEYKPQINRYKIVENEGIKEYYYSSLYFLIPISRENKTSFYFKTFVPTLVSILILFIGFILHQSQIDLRMNLAIGSIFVLISNLIVTQRYLPDVAAFTLIEKTNIGSLFIVFITILFFVASYRFIDKYPKKKWILINRLYISLTIFCFLFMIGFLLLF